MDDAPINGISFQDVERRVETAIKELFTKDIFLLQYDLNERTITHRLAIYLQDVFPDWDVDCEYNRNHDKPKRLHLRARQSRTDDTQGNTVFPDIIVHHRDKDDNLLVIEVKKSTNRVTDDNDLSKLLDFREQYGYLFAIFIRFRTGEEYVEPIHKQWV